MNTPFLFTLYICPISPKGDTRGGPFTPARELFLKAVLCQCFVVAVAAILKCHVNHPRQLHSGVL